MELVHLDKSRELQAANVSSVGSEIWTIDDVPLRNYSLTHPSTREVDKRSGIEVRVRQSSHLPRCATSRSGEKQTDRV